MKNKEQLKVLAVLIKNYKLSLKKKSPLFGKFGEPWEVQCKLPQMSFEARQRSVAQALLNRKMSVEDIEDLDYDDFTELLAKLGIEKYIKPDTERLCGGSVEWYMNGG